MLNLSSILLIVSVTFSGLNAEDEDDRDLDAKDYRDCGCPPDAGVAIKGQPKAYLFKGDDFVTFDRTWSDRQIDETRTAISDKWPGLPSDIDAGFPTESGFCFIRDESFFLYNINRTLIAKNSTKKWENFPKEVDAIELMRRKSGGDNTSRELRVFTETGYRLCRLITEDSMDEETMVTCNERDAAPSKVTYAFFNNMGRPISALISFEDGFRVIFGSHSYCFVAPNGKCRTRCHSMIFECPDPSFWKIHFQFFAVLSLMLMVLILGLWYYNKISPDGIRGN